MIQKEKEEGISDDRGIHDRDVKKEKEFKRLTSKEKNLWYTHREKKDL